MLLKKNEGIINTVIIESSQGFIVIHVVKYAFQDVYEFIML